MESNQKAFLEGAKKREIKQSASAPGFLTGAKKIKENPKNAIFPYENENDLEREIERNQAQITSRILESYAGLPGDFQSLIGSLTGLDQEKVPFTSEESAEKGLQEGEGFKLQKKKTNFTYIF